MSCYLSVLKTYDVPGTAADSKIHSKLIGSNSFSKYLLGEPNQRVAASAPNHEQKVAEFGSNQTGETSRIQWLYVLYNIFLRGKQRGDSFRKEEIPHVV